MSDTPKTDAFEALVNRPTNWWDFARELERENAALLQEIDSLKSALEALTLSTMQKEEYP